jgi:hypothetical protein
MRISELDFTADPVTPHLIDKTVILTDEQNPQIAAAQSRVKQAQARKKQASQANTLQVQQAQAFVQALKTAQARKRMLATANKSHATKN